MVGEMSLELFSRLCGSQPYLWQERLFTGWLADGRLPGALDIPTGLGKTKVIAAWLCARMLGASLPRRLVYVVDRRVVVDQATTEAETIADRLAAVLSDESAAKEDRKAYRTRLGLGDDDRIPISTLRGQFVDNRKWMDKPFGAAIVVGTVDMIGSRLLFSGYGVSAGMRPAHAGLLGSDTLLVLDEAHLVPPFETLLQQIAAIHNEDRHKNEDIVPPFAVLTLSATGRTRDTDATFSLNDADESDPPVAARLSATKRLKLEPDVSTKELSAALAERAWTRGFGNRRVIVFSNSRNVAQEVETDLSERVRREFGKQTVLTGLLVGERRLYERTLEYDSPGQDGTSVFNRFRPGAAPGPQPAFLVATSAGEVGIDLDADDLVCDLVPWERMVQRFGRVNRREEPGVAYIDVIPSLSEKDAESAVAAERFEQIRAPFMAAEWTMADDGTRDASPGELRRLKARIPETLVLASTPAPFCPKLDRPTVQSFAMTSLREHSGRPSIQPYLRGWTDDRPQGAIAWRRLFPVPADYDRMLNRETEKRDLIKELEDFFEAAPPHVTELLEAPADRIAETIRKRIDAYGSFSSEQRAALLAEAGGTTGHEPIIVVLDSRNDVEDVFDISQFKTLARSARNLSRLLADHTVVIDARLGGLSDSGLLDAKASNIPPTIDGAAWKLSADLYGQRQVKWGSRPAAPTSADWRFGGYRWVPNADNEDSPVLWVEVLRSTDAGAGDPAITRKAQALAQHHEWTREEAQRLARGLQLPESKATMLATAAFAHDAGKARQLWQDAMNAAAEGRPFAKTTGGAAPRALAGYRHEFGSLGDILEQDLFSGLKLNERELALHLVAAHHGRCRPVVNASDPERTPAHSRHLAQETAIRYIQLERIWGTWGLAWWEAMLRSADWAASARANKDA